MTDTKVEPKKSQWDKYVYTIIMLLNHAAFGMTRTMFFSAMVDLKVIMNTTMNNISLFNSFVSIGYLLGSLFGFLYKYLNRQMTVVILLTLMSTASALIPYSQTLSHIYMCGLVIGLGSGCWNGMANVWLIELWKNKSAPFLQLIQFMYGVGTILSPLVNQLFLNEDESAGQTIAAPVLNSTFVNITSDTVNDRRESLKTPFLINGLIQITFPLLLTVMFVIKRYEIPEQNFQNMDYEDKKTEQKKNLFKEGQESPRKTLIVLFAMLFMFYNACEGLMFQFGPSYYRNMGLRLSATKACRMISVMATAYTIGRGLNVLIAIKVRSKHMLQYHFGILIVGFAALFFSERSVHILTMANIILGFGFSAVFPAVLSYFKQYMDITNKLGTILIFSSESMATFTPYILGTFIEMYSIIFIIVEVFYFVLGLIIFLIIVHLINKTKNKSISKLKLLDNNSIINYV